MIQDVQINYPIKHPCNFAEVLTALETIDLLPNQRRDMISAIKRLCAMAGRTPCKLNVEVADSVGVDADIRLGTNVKYPSRFNGRIDMPS